MLPCNLIIQEVDNGKTKVAVIDPLASMRAVENNSLKEVVMQIRDNLQLVINGL